MNKNTIKSEQAKILDEISAILKEGGKTYEIIPKIESALAKNPASRFSVDALVMRLKNVVDGAVPKTWLDPLLTGSDAILPAEKTKYDGKDIEKLLNAVKNRLKQHIKAELIELDEAV